MRSHFEECRYTFGKFPENIQRKDPDNTVMKLDKIMYAFAMHPALISKNNYENPTFLTNFRPHFLKLQC